MKAFLYCIHTIIWFFVFIAIIAALSDIAYSQSGSEPESILIEKEIFQEAVDKLAKRTRIANGVRYSIPSGFIECGVSIYSKNGKVMASKAFTGEGKSRAIHQNMSRKYPKAINPCQFFEAIPQDAELLAVLHTHPSFPYSLLPSGNDMMFSNQYDVPIFMIEQEGARYRYYYSFGKQRPSIRFLENNDLMREGRDETTKAYCDYLESYGRKFVSDEISISKFKFRDKKKLDATLIALQLRSN